MFIFSLILGDFRSGGGLDPVGGRSGPKTKGLPLLACRLSTVCDMKSHVWQLLAEYPVLSVLWSLRPQNRAAAATCGRGRCELPAILMLTPKIASS